MKMVMKLDNRLDLLVTSNSLSWPASNLHYYLFPAAIQEKKTDKTIRDGRSTEASQEN